MRNIVAGSLKILEMLVREERVGRNTCRAPHKNGYVCSRSEGHSGIHVALGLDRMCIAWLSGYESADSNAKIAALLSFLYTYVGKGTCSAIEKSGWRCMREEGHTGAHVATGSLVDAIWHSRDSADA